MPYCSKCGSEVADDMIHCPKCGATLRAEQVSRRAHEKEEKYEKDEKHEKHEKGEKDEKAEKHEKGETSRFWAFLGGMILVILGVLSFLTVFFNMDDQVRGALFLVVIGAFIIIIALYGAIKASQRNPQP